MNDAVTAQLHFLPRSQTGGPVRDVDLRSRSNGLGMLEPMDLRVMNARGHPNLGLRTSGFELVHSPSAVTDFHDC
ncbi:MAG: hypothetical protein OXJ53_15605, partial [Gammaproteobacteria bacterium]|nr:hypothetical protein [Gammaproteobacteria bacterium]